MRKFFLFSLFLIVCIFAVREEIAGRILRGPLEEKLTYLFGMPVTIRRLKADILTGRVHATGVQFTNQPGFAAGPHLDLRTLDFDINLSDLRRQRVTIGTIVLGQLYYYIESIPFGEKDYVTNVGTWVRHIKKINHEASTARKSTSSGTWKVTIDKIVVRNGTFIYYGHSHPKAKKYFLFRHLEGYLAGFHWPSDPTVFDQEVRLRGMFGKKVPAPFWIKGNADFATRDVGFDLQGEISNGSVLDHLLFFSGLPIRIEGGEYDLKTQTLCLHKKLQSDTEIVLKNLKVKPSASATGVIWGIPVLASVNFLQTQKNILLRVPVLGNVSDPHFEFPKAFRAAFQTALMQYTRKGLSMIAMPIKMVTQTGEAVVGTPLKMVEEMGRFSKAVGLKAVSTASNVSAATTEQAKESLGIKDTEKTPVSSR